MHIIVMFVGDVLYDFWYDDNFKLVSIEPHVAVDAQTKKEIENVCNRTSN